MRKISVEKNIYLAILTKISVVKTLKGSNFSSMALSGLALIR
jgi:hypothetical protein